MKAAWKWSGTLSPFSEEIGLDYIRQIVWREEKPAGGIASQFGITFGAVSQHLRVLRESGAVDFRKQGHTHFYKANHQKLGPLAQYLETFWRGRLTELKTLIEEPGN